MFIALQGVRKIQQNLINAYIADIAKHSGKENAMHIERIWRNIPAQLAEGKTIIAVSHDDRYFHIADEIVKLEYGSVVEIKKG